MYMLYFTAPETHIDAIKNAIFAVGAGRIGHYSHCAWQTLGEGQFMPLSGNHAFIGEMDILEKIPEFKVEIMCADEQIHAAVAALKLAHPYETPTYQVIRLEAF